MAVRDVVQAAAGQGGDKLYVEDVFSTYLYAGNNGSQTIENGVDLAGEGGMVWMKSRNATYNHGLMDTARGTSSVLCSNLGDTAKPYTDITSFNSNGFTLGFYSGWFNSSGSNYASWTWRKAPKFFDVVTWTGNSTPRTIAHNLGSVPGCIFVKRLDGLGSDWNVYHRSLGNSARLLLNATAQAYDVGNVCWNSTDPTDTVFSLGTNSGVNTNGATYVAYVYAHDAGGFGDDGEQNVISCGSYVGDSVSAGKFINLGYEPQWVLTKNSTGGVNDWHIQDVMRGAPTPPAYGKPLRPNSGIAEYEGTNAYPAATGFYATGDDNNGGTTYIYIAIRRPMKTPESGTEVFGVQAYQGNNSSTRVLQTGFPVDLTLNPTARTLTNSDKWQVFTRLLGTTRLRTTDTSAEQAATTIIVRGFDDNTGLPIANSGDINGSYPYVNYSFRRAPGFMDVVCYTGTGVAGRTVAHNLGVVPEMMIVKNRTTAGYGWGVYTAPVGNTAFLQLNATSAPNTNIVWWNNTSPTSSLFTVGSNQFVNEPADNYVAYLFASLPGVSKVSSYTGTGANLNVDCGFSAGARFILIRRTDASGDWYVWDSARGIVAGNDPYLLLNSTAAEVTSTDYIDPLASGFTVTSSAPAALNASGGTYIFLAIA